MSIIGRMSITDELREWAHGFTGPYKRNEQQLLAIADRIDAEHGASVIASGVKIVNDYVRLPGDADGEPIHVGDVVIYDYDGVRTGTPETVKWIAMGETEVHISTEHHSYTKPSTLRHYHKPTVEDVMVEFVERLDEIGSEDDCCGVDEQECRACIRRDIAAAYAEYAEKLREVVEHDRD